MRTATTARSELANLPVAELLAIELLPASAMTACFSTGGTTLSAAQRSWRRTVAGWTSANRPDDPDDPDPRNHHTPPHRMGRYLFPPCMVEERTLAQMSDEELITKARERFNYANEGGDFDDWEQAASLIPKLADRLEAVIGEPQ